MRSITPFDTPRLAGGIGSLLAVFASVALHGCGASAPCAATGGEWNDCAVVQARCVDGEVKSDDQADLTICEEGCTCPSEAPVWDAEAGCVTEADCGGGS